jgi:RHS repeat-associated protein
VWRNLQQNRQHTRVHYSSFFIHHSSLSYTFSAKEKDSETGLSYFGSRYYSSDLSIWLSVDPKSDKYASLSPYVYCADNPVKLVDPNGEEIDDNLDKWKYNKDTKKLTWVSNAGGKYHQTVVETENTSFGERVNRTIDYDGAIGLMFDFSVVSKKWDGIINGALDVYAGGQTAKAGAMIMSGGSVVTSGASFPIGATIFGAGSYQTVSGLMTIANAIAGRGVDMYEQQDMVRDICKSAGNSIFSLLSTSKNSKIQDVVKSIGRSTGALIISATWAGLVRHATTHPTCNKVLPAGAIVH